MILLSGLRPYNRSEHSGNSNSHGFNDGLKLGFLVFKALKTKADNFSMVGAFVLANNKENLNMDGCLWYFGGISSFLKAVYFGHTNKKCTSVSGVLQRNTPVTQVRSCVTAKKGSVAHTYIASVLAVIRQKKS